MAAAAAGGGIPLPSGGLGGVQQGQSADNAQIAQACQTGASANQQLDCEVVAVDNSLDGYWSDAFARSGQSLQPPRLNFFTGGVSTGCGSATSDVGPFYCPADAEIYIDLTFFKELETRFGAQGGSFSRAYVIAHEYGHHVQNLLGTNRAGPGGRLRPRRPAPCGWSCRPTATRACGRNHATTVPDVRRPAADQRHHAAGRHEPPWTPRPASATTSSSRTSAAAASTSRSSPTAAPQQREKWLTTGYQSGDPAQCDTFARGVNLG